MRNDRALVTPGIGVGDGTPGAEEPVRPVPRRLSGREKAAVIVRLLLTEGADLPLEDLPDPLQEKLTHQMGRMGLVDRVTLGAVVTEFAEALDAVGLSFPHGLVGALMAMDGKIAPDTAARLRREAGVRQIGDPWTRLRELPAAKLAEMTLAESTEVAAVLLSKLDTPRAAEILGLIPGPDARRITYAISQTTQVTPLAVDRIGWSLVAQLDRQPPRAFTDEPEKRVGDILNHSTTATREEVLSALDAEDAGFATGVRRALFTFPDIPARLPPRDVPAAMRAVDQAQLITALAGATAEEEAAAATFLLDNMPSRLADGLRDEIAERGTPRRGEAEAAMTAVVTAIRVQVAEGTITLVAPEEEEEKG
ncbi:flagellar motor switch protein FliG [Cribrihabitans marinus]|uniref:Flagellar motor switch protein FliG n=1 Tax=Cribrihabitans marinus TaxID=1227549 RepID=A0A1H6VGM1_9RHOB|nr:FliG C-terminal domain-containing protein [Cribrihabitans marinus]GGH26361.1 flagellar motor switch protein FliG [Cribrihabitans marinus]SEI99355.1 flagellar motor switch protein FliG [Cribrihabitans marinus]